MKKFFFFAIVALGMMASCQKQGVETTPADDNSPVAVSFGVNAAPANVTKTKAALDSWGGEDLYIYGFAREATTLDEPFLPNVKVTAPSGDAVMSGDVTPKQLVNQVEESYYYTIDNKPFDFYGYYVADATTNDGVVAEPVVDGNRIYVPFTITGTQDLMLAKADPAADVAGTEVPAARAYSAFSARKGVKPVLDFKHQLARFNFYIVAGSESANKVSLNSISIENAKVAGEFNVVSLDEAAAPRGIVNVDAETLASLPLEGVSADVPANCTWNTETGSANEKVKVGESIMVIPGDAVYELMYSLTQEGVTESVSPAEPIKLDITKFKNTVDGQNVFTAGYQYDVTLTIYGLEEVVITVSLSEWENGGDYTYDPDAEWE